jgi:hypothetical protein
MSIICGSAGRLLNKVDKGFGRGGGFRSVERSLNVNDGKKKNGVRWIAARLGFAAARL